MGDQPVLAAALSILNEHPVDVLQATSWVQVLVLNRDIENKHGMPRPEGLCDPVKIFDHSCYQEKQKTTCKKQLV